ncbi:uncharacterized protein SAPINGB_P004007 [Magnusiomyces paraingens]|uniref:Uncharacterized protein n=1 Tax=Magnusiomyces paraingens TaxID=2606893 RepID=A0A5E8BTA9_9ASCO|nr:uncharacterized protein SAPINGB_P004007 [Saprochaete ingens]VVT54301.1 unnamed protein product [Saprochaete ingens]
MPKATSVITNQAIVRNALNKPRGSGRRNNGANNSNNNNVNSLSSSGNSLTNRGRKSLTLYNGNESGNLQMSSNRSGTFSKPRAPKQQQQQQQQQQQGRITDSFTSGGRKNRAKLLPLEQQEQDSNYTATNDASETNPLPDSQRRRIRSSGSSSSFGTNNNNNNNNNYINNNININSNNNNATSPSKRNRGLRQQTSKPFDSADPSPSPSTVSLPNLPLSGRRGKSSKPNLDNSSRPLRRGGKRSKQQDDSENSEEEKDLKEVLFPDLYGHKSSNNGSGPQRCKLYNNSNNNNNNNNNFNNYNNNNSFDNNPTAATAGSGSNGGSSTTSPSKICFAGSSFSNTPDPSALPKPAFMGKISPKAHHSNLSIDTSDNLTDQDAASSVSSSPSSVSSSPIKQTVSSSPKEVSLKQSQEQLKQVSPPVSQVVDIQQQQQPQQAASFYGLVPGGAAPYMNGPVYPYSFGPTGPYPSQNGAMPVPMAMNNPASSPYFYEPNSPFYAPPLSGMPYPMPPQQQFPQQLPPLQQQQPIGQPLGLHKNQENFALENDLKRLLNVGH